MGRILYCKDRALNEISASDTVKYKFLFVSWYTTPKILGIFKVISVLVCYGAGL